MDEFVSRLMFVGVASPLVLCIYKFVLNLLFIYYYILYCFLAGQGSDKYSKGYLCFRLVCTNGK